MSAHFLFQICTTFPPAITTAWTSPVSFIMSATGKICLKIDFKTNLNFSVQEMSRNFHSFIDSERLRQSVHKGLEWYQLCRYWSFKSHHRVQQHICQRRYYLMNWEKSEHVFHQEVTSWRDSTWKSFPAWFQAARGLGHHTTSPSWSRGRINTSHHLKTNNSKVFNKKKRKYPVARRSSQTRISAAQHCAASSWLEATKHN